MILFRNGQKIADAPRLEMKFEVAAGQRLDLQLAALGGGDAVFDIDIIGSSASVDVRSLYVCDGDDRLGIKVNLRHLVPGSKSEQLFKGIVSGCAKVSFDGLIKVDPDAQQTEAYQTSQSLQLSDDATVRTSPQLEIYADDVKCSHGATVGSLNEDEQFYMRSRGISLSEARRLQMISFLAPVMAGLPDSLCSRVQDSLF